MVNWDLNMNKIYRLVWNRETGTMVVASELAKSDGGRTAAAVRSSSSPLAVSTLTAALLLAISGQAMAVTGTGSATNYCFYDENSQSVICGDDSTSIADTYDGKKAKSVALGIGAKTTGESNVALGANASAAKTAATALGAGAKAMNDYGVAIGFEAVANNTWDISIGRRAGADARASGDGRNIAIGDGALKGAKNANNNTVLGTSAGASLTGTFNIAIGAYANSPTALGDENGPGVTADNTIALGQRAIASSSSSIAQGNRSKATGTISNAIGASAEASGAYSIANGYGAQASGKNAIAIGSAREQIDARVKATGANAIAIGSVSTLAKSENTVAIGRKAAAAGNNTVSLGAESGSIGVEADAAGSLVNVNARTKAGKTSANGLVNMTNIGYKAGAGNINNNYGVNIGYEAGAGGYNSFYGEGVSIGNKAGGVNTGNATVKAAMEAASQIHGGVATGVIITGNTNTAISSRAGVNALGHDNVAIGKDAGGYSSGNANIAIGRHAGRVSVLNPSGVRVIDENAFSAIKNTIAMGEWAYGSADNAIAIGTLARVEEKGLKSVWDSATSSYKNEGSESLNAMAVGHGAVAKGNSAIALGASSRVDFMNSIALGARAQALSYNSTVIGVDAKSKGYSSIAIGDKAEAGTQNADATPEFNYAIAIGTSSKATGETSVALGSNAQATVSRGTALGVRSEVTAGMGVALGGYSIANRAHGVTGADPLGAKETGAAENVWTSTAGAVSVGGGINPANGNKISTRQIINVAAGSADTDAVNVAQLKAAGFKLTTSSSTGEVAGTSAENVQNGETVTIDAGDNIKLTQAGNEITVATKKDVAFDTVTVGGVTIDKSTNKVSGLAAGELSATSTDAVNGSQLHATNQNVAANATNIQANADNIAKGINVGGTTGSNQYALGDTINIKGDSNISSTTVAGGVQLALAPVLNVGPATGGKPVKIDGNAGTVGGLSNTTFDPANITSGQAATEDQLKAVNDKAVAAKTKVDAGDNISVTETVDATTGASTYTVATKKDVAFDTVTVGGVTIDKSTNKVSGLAAGELSATSTDAVNGSQLHATNQNVAANATNIQANADNIAKGINVGGTTGSNQYALGDTINIKGDSNISSTTVAGGVQLALAPVLNVGPATGGKPVKIDGNAGTVGGLSNTTFDPANITSGQAATEDQLKAVNDKAVAAKTKVDAGDNISVTETVDATTGASTYTVATKKDVAFDTVTVGGVTIDKTTNRISGLAAGVGDTDAVNMSQLKAVQTLVNAGWTVTDSAGNKANIGPNGVVTFSSADSNISVVQNGADQDGKVEITLSRDLDVDSVTAGGNKLDANGLAIAGGPTISAAGIDMAGKKISNLGDGTEDGDAVNLGQLKNYVGEETAKVKTHYYSVNDGGSKGGNYDNDGATASGAIAAGVDTTATAENAVAMGKGAAASHAGSVALGSGAQTQAVDNTGTFMLNGGAAAGVNAVAVVSVGSKGNERRIVNVAAGRLSADSTDAVNGSQLFAVGTALNNLGNATALALGGNTTYTPGGGLSVNLTVGGNTYTNVQDALNAVAGGGSGATKVVAGTNTQVTQNGDTYTVSVVDNPVVEGKTTFNGGIEVAGDQTVNMGGNVVRNVAAGVADTDAVNVGQLNGAIAGANAYTDNRFNQLANDMWQLDRGYRGATASAMAMAGLPQAYLPGKSMFSAAVGGYRGEYGLAFGLSGITDNGKWVYKAQASGNTARDWGFSAGVGVQW
ncbi:hypothetical protein CO610_03105 [Lysobacteraceae bacterium NML95-0200]|nr:hypothetical protein CO610_03105 [Xanthomonadaceae bacterium NML95-0200]